MSGEKQAWEPITDAIGCMVGMVKCQKWLEDGILCRHVYIHFPLGKEMIWAKRVFLTDSDGSLRGFATVFTYDSFEAVSRSEGMRPNDIPEVTAL